MNFLAPVAFAFAAAIPVVILFYLLKRKRVVRLVSSTLLWQKFLAETQASAPVPDGCATTGCSSSRLLLLALAVLALARPYFAGNARQQPPAGGHPRCLGLDAEHRRVASPLREGARRGAQVGGRPPGRRPDGGPARRPGHTEVKQSPTSDKTALRRAIQCLRATAIPPPAWPRPSSIAGAFTFEKRGEEEVASGKSTSSATARPRTSTSWPTRTFPSFITGSASAAATPASSPSTCAPTRRTRPAGRLCQRLQRLDATPSRPRWNCCSTRQLIETRAAGPAAPRHPAAGVLGHPGPGRRFHGAPAGVNDDLAADNEASIVSLLPLPRRSAAGHPRQPVPREGPRRARPTSHGSPWPTISPMTAAEFDFAVLDDVLPTTSGPPATCWPSVRRRRTGSR